MNNDSIEVTSMSRPDPSWRFTDQAGHEFRWWAKRGGQDAPADGYDPQARHHVPGLIEVIDYEPPEDAGDEDYTRSHLECRLCGAHVLPGSTADTYRQFIPGLRGGG